ncbi:MAG: hypothetical protein WAL98_16915, partial [Desulfatiglandaceae bacterium]
VHGRTFYGSIKFGRVPGLYRPSEMSRREAVIGPWMVGRKSTKEIFRDRRRTNESRENSRIY